MDNKFLEYLKKSLQPQATQASEMPSPEDMAFMASQAPEVQAQGPDTQAAINDSVMNAPASMPQQQDMNVSGMSLSMPMDLINPQSRKMQAEYDQMVKQQLSQQEKGLGDQKELLAMLAQSPTATDYTPLAGFYQQLTGKQLPYQAPKSISGTDLYGQYGGIQKGEQELTQDKLAALKAMLAHNNENAALRLALQGQKQNTNQQRSDNMTHRAFVNTVTHDKVANDVLKQTNQLNNALSLMDNPDLIVNPALFEEFQSAAIAGMGIGGSSGVAERESRKFNLSTEKAAKLKEWFLGKPVAISEIGVPLDQLKHMITNEMANKEAVYKQRLNALGSAYDNTFYNKKGNEAYRQDKEKFVDENLNQLKYHARDKTTKELEEKKAAKNGGKAPVMSFEEFKKQYGG